MLKVMTGPKGCIAYLDARDREGSAYPALNIPCRAFSSATGMQPANLTTAPGVLSLRRRDRKAAAVAMFGEPKKRES